MSKSIQFQKDGEKLYPCPFYPVGSIYLSITTTNPSTYFGGTWSQIAQGRTLVGVDTSDSDFNTVKKTGGEKTHTLSVTEMPSHTHTFPAKYGTTRTPTSVLTWELNCNDYNDYRGSPTGGDEPHNNLQPYYTCYIWLRTA